MAKIGLPKGSGKGLKVWEKTVKSQGILKWILSGNPRVPTCKGKVREICFFFKVREKSGNSVKWSGKLENLQKSGSFKIMLG